MSAGFDFHPAKYCRERGKPHLWTERMLNATREFTDDLQSLDGSEKEDLKKSIEQVTAQTGSQDVAVSKINKYAKKIDKKGDVLKGILTELATEATKKKLSL